MRRPEHPLVVSTVVLLARRFGVDPDDLWAWMDRKRPAPRWFVDAAVEAFHPTVRETDFDVDESLTSRGTNSTVSGVPTTNSQLMDKMPKADPRQVNARRARSMMKDTLKHPGAKQLAKKGVTFVEVALKLSEKLKRTVPRSTVRSWFKDPKKSDDYRAIPKDAADAMKAEWDIPLDAWHRIIPAVD